MPTSGIVDQIMQGYIRDGIAKAHREGAAAVVIQLDTPGGDLNATREIVKSLLNAPVPVIVWVGPSGSRAASAGTFITLAAHVAVMAPGHQHRRGHAHSTAAARTSPRISRPRSCRTPRRCCESISTERNRNVEWALKTVTDAESYTVDEAVAAGGVDGMVEQRGRGHRLRQRTHGQRQRPAGHARPLAGDRRPTCR